MEQHPAFLIRAVATRLGFNVTTKADGIHQINNMDLPPAALQALFASEQAVIDLQKGHLPSIKLPKYDDANPRAWIRQCSVITPVFSPHVIISRLPTNIVAQIDVDDICNCSSYDEFSALVLPKVEGSQEVGLARLLESQELGDMQPSQFLLKLQNLAQQAQQPIDSALVKQKFITAMPPSIRAPLAALKSPPIKEIAEAADRMMATTKPLPVPSYNTVAAVSPVHDLAEQVAAILGRGQYHGRYEPRQQFQRRENVTDSGKRYQNRTRDSSNHATRSRDGNSGTGTICYYHMRFGNNANKCTAPCDFQRLQKAMSGKSTPQHPTTDPKNE